MSALLKQARDQLGIPGGAKGFLKGAQIYNCMTLVSTIRNIVLNYVQHIFPVVAQHSRATLSWGLAKGPHRPLQWPVLFWP